MKYCEEFAALISAGVDNALTADERQKLMDHLAQCPACREAYTQMLLMHDAFTDWDEEVPGDLAGDVMATIRKEKAVAKRRKRSWLPLVAAAACCALVFIGYQGTNFSQNTNDAALNMTTSKATTPESIVVADTVTADADAKTDADNGVSYTTAKEDILTGDEEEQLLEGVLTYFSGVPEAAVDDAAADGATAVPTESRAETTPAQQELTVLISSESALVDWMNEYTDAHGYLSEDDGSTAWLITTEEYAQLTAWLNEGTLAWDEHLVELPATGSENLVCVIYLPS